MSKASQGAQRNNSPPALAITLHSQVERRHRAIFSYQFALGKRRGARLTDWPWATWLITLATCEIWCMTAYQVASQAGAHSWQALLHSMFALDENANVLVTFGAKYTPDIVAGQYWRLLTPIFLHANLL